MDKKIRVLHVVVEMGFGGYENYVMNIFREIDKTKFDFSFLVLRDRVGFFEKEINELGGRVFHCTFADDRKIGKFKKDLNKILDANKFDILHCHNRYYSMFYLPTLKKKIPTIVIHSHIANKEPTLKGYITWLLGQYPANKGYHQVACSQIAGEFVFGKKKQFTVCPNCIDTSRFFYNKQTSLELRKKYNIPESAFVIGHIGRFAPQKNHTFLIKQFKEVVKNRADAYLCLCGHGVEKEKILKMVEKDEDLKKKVIFLEQGETFKYYSLFDVFAFPSLHEGFPLVLLESQAAGCRTLVSSTITTEVNLTKCIKYLPLNDELWVSELISAEPLTEKERLECGDIMSKTIFDSKKASEFLSEYYFKAVEEDLKKKDE